METIEVIVYTTIFLIVGVMTLHFIGAIDIGGIYRAMSGSIQEEKEIGFKKVDKKGFVSEVINFWEHSGMCEVPDTRSMYIETNVSGDSINKSYLFEKIKLIGFCSTIQSASHDCGDREHVNFTADIDLPHVIRLECNVTEGIMKIRG